MKPTLAFMSRLSDHPWIFLLYPIGVIVVVLLLAWWLNSRNND